MSEETKLLTCPFCSGHGSSVNDGTAVVCTNCGYIVTYYVWNTRSPDVPEAIRVIYELQNYLHHTDKLRFRQLDGYVTKIKKLLEVKK